AKDALEESVRRVASIALVHETLAMSSDEVVEFDGIVDRVAAAAAEVASTELTVAMRRDGTFGVLPAEVATSLVMVLNELLLNAVEHGFPPDGTGAATPATVVVSAHRFRTQLHVSVADNGRGLPEGFDAGRGGRLGLQIVRALATGELRGNIELRNRVKGGTEAVLVVPLGRR
ncbi:MAG TPA: sensor histidine kinase, partial [Micromonosporaceae bacterium]|nr:sensor histidine kinase [Micromonosporaceae bacterium]